MFCCFPVPCVWTCTTDQITSGDKPLTDALELMNNEGVTSLPVLDNQNNVIGNISHVDVKVRLNQCPHKSRNC